MTILESVVNWRIGIERAFHVQLPYNFLLAIKTNRAARYSHALRDVAYGALFYFRYY